MSSKVRRHQYSKHEWALVCAFLEEAQQKIRSDGAEVVEPFKGSFEYVADHLTDSDLTVGSAKAAANLSGNYTTKILEIVGMNPKDYINYNRIMLAQRILRRVHVFVYRVAFTVGFNDQSSFSRTYGRIVGCKPSDEPKETTVSTKAINYIAEIDTGYSGSVNLDQFWRIIRHSNRLEIMGQLNQIGRALDVSHFYFLLSKAKHEGRFDRQKGLALAWAAVDVLTLVTFWRREELLAEKALAYASLSNSYRMVFDLDSAAKYAQLADELLPSTARRSIYAQIKFFKALLMWWQDNAEGAIQLIEDILPLVRKHGSVELLARTLLLAGEIHDSCGRADQAVPFFSEAVSLEQSIDDSYVVFSAHFSLALFYARLSRPEEATSRYEDVKIRWKCVQGQVSESHMCYLSALVSKINDKTKEAELMFIEARQGFLDGGLFLFSSLVSLDLALLYIESGRDTEAFSTAVSVIPLISRYSHSETITALTILQEADRRKRIQITEIKAALNHLEQARKDPTSNLTTQG